MSSDARTTRLAFLVLLAMPTTVLATVLATVAVQAGRRRAPDWSDR